VIVFGGYGVFGTLVCRELARLGASVTVAGRDAHRAAALARDLGPNHRGLGVDATDAAACRAAIADHRVAVHCAGPFSPENHVILDACHDVGCHYVDIADDRRYAAFVRAQDERFRKRRLTAAFGCSSLPSLSGALAIAARAARVEPPRRARVTLFIGDDNPKSAAAVLSVVRVLGQKIAAPQGALRGFRDHERVELPPPFGAREAYAFESPDYDLLPDTVGVSAVTVLVGFENALAGPSFAALARLGGRWGRGTARVLATLGRMHVGGSSGGVVLSELFWADGHVERALVQASYDGQRLAALPAALAAQSLAAGGDLRRGAVTAYELLGADALVACVRAAVAVRGTGVV
jgi:hypothetical protein